MQIIEYQKSFSARKLNQYQKLILKSIFIVILLMVVIYFFLIKVPTLKNYRWLIFLLGIILILRIVNKVNFLDYEADKFFYGKTGEEEVVAELKEFLDDNYIYIRNYIIPNTKIGDIDGLIIGPRGIILLEIKNYEGIFRISGIDMYRRRGHGNYQLYKKNPIKQILRQKECLANFLTQKGINIRISPILVLVDGKIEGIFGKSEVFITEISDLVACFLNVYPLPNWDKNLCDKIIDALGLKVS
jgi:hypothetical protein